MLSPYRTHILAIAFLVLLGVGCAQVPIPTSPAPQAATTSAPQSTATVVPTSAPATRGITAAAPPATSTLTAVSASAGKGDPVAGAKLFPTLPCSSCHDVTHPFPGGEICPNLGNVATEAARIIRSPDYHGKATDAAGYIRESIMDPNAYIVAGDNYINSEGQSVMPKDFGKILTPSQIDDLVAYLLTLK